jgi:hypothetical protein
MAAVLTLAAAVTVLRVPPHSPADERDAGPVVPQTVPQEV